MTRNSRDWVRSSVVGYHSAISPTRCSSSVCRFEEASFPLYAFVFWKATRSTWSDGAPLTVKTRSTDWTDDS